MATHHENIMRDFVEKGFHEQVIRFYELNIQHLGEMGEGIRVLDFGADSGFVSTSLAEMDYVKSIIACDRDPDYMREMKEHPKIKKITCDCGGRLPFEDGCFDVVICRFVLHHLEHKNATLREFERVLANGGVLLLSDPVLPEHSKHVLNPLYRLRENHHNGYLGYYETIDLLEESGFQVVIARPYRYRYPSFDAYLKAVDDGFPENSPREYPELVKSKLKEAWNRLDERTKREMGIDPKNLSAGFSYYLVDWALHKSNGGVNPWTEKY